MLESEKIKVLESISSETELRTELVVPLLRKMSVFSEVIDNQGAEEAGVDVIGISTSPFKKPEYTAFILKRGDITLKSADKKNIVNIVETQIRMAMRHPLTHPKLPASNILANRVIVLTNGKISNNAEYALKKSFASNSELNLDFVGQDRLIQHIDELWPRFYEDRRPFLSSYAQKLLNSLDIVNFDQLGQAIRPRTLTDIYVDALLYEEESPQSNSFSFFEKEPISGEQLCKKSHPLMVITSGPGGGKSTLLKEIAITESKHENSHVAVYMHARDILESRDIQRKASKILSEISNDSADDIYDELNSTKLLLLVDGLDEIAIF